MHCGATPRTLDALRDTLEKREQAAALNAVASAVDVRRGQVDDADLLARAAAGEPAPEPPPTGLSPSHGEVPRREGAGRTTILYDRSHVSSMRGCCSFRFAWSRAPGEKSKPALSMRPLDPWQSVLLLGDWRHRASLRPDPPSTEPDTRWPLGAVSKQESLPRLHQPGDRAPLCR